MRKTSSTYDERKQKILEQIKKLKIEKQGYLKKLTLFYFFSFVKQDEIVTVLEKEYENEKFLKELSDYLMNFKYFKNSKIVETEDEVIYDRTE
ncbi:MAG: hypothetical protein ACRC5G_01675, partial [Cetobacterium sp.]